VRKMSFDIYINRVEDYSTKHEQKLQNDRKIRQIFYHVLLDG